MKEILNSVKSTIQIEISFTAIIDIFVFPMFMGVQGVESFECTRAFINVAAKVKSLIIYMKVF